MHSLQEVTLNELANAYRAGQRVFRNIEVVGLDQCPSLYDLEMPNVGFLDSCLDSVHFLKVNLSGCTFKNCNLKLCIFEHCNLHGTTWDECLVCSLGIIESKTSDIRVTKVEAYGGAIESATEFVEYAIYKGKAVRQ